MIYIYKQLRQKLGLCCFSFAHYLEKCFTQIYRALYGDVMLVPLVAQTRGGVLPEKFGRGVRPASQNPYPIYDQNL